MILEEAPTQILTTINKPYFVITLSGKTAKALKQREVDLLTWLNDASYAHIPINVISYTLNKGRSHFNHRAAWVVDSKDTLREQLQVAMDKKKSDAWFTGVVDKYNKPEDDAIYTKVLKNSFGELKKTINNKKEYRETLSALANLYVKGYSIDWELLHQGEPRQRVSLPTYPFAKEQYWAPHSTLAKNDDPTTTVQLHPLVHMNTSRLLEQSFETLLKSDLFYLQDHVIEGHRILPGVAYLEMARAAGVLSLKNAYVTIIENIVWSQPIIVDAGSQKITLSLYPKDDGVIFEIRSALNEVESVMHSHGEMLWNANKVPVQNHICESIENIHARCQQILLHEEVYHQFSQVQFDYGKNFQTLEWLKIGKDEVIGKLQLTETMIRASDRDQYYLHPALLDGALQSIMGLNLSASKDSQIPFSLDRIELFQAIPDSIYVHVKRRKSSQQVQQYDIDLLDETGKLYVRLTGLSTRSLNKNIKEKTTLGFYKPQWQALQLENASQLSLNAVLVFSNDEQQVVELKKNLQVYKSDLTLIQVQAGSNFKEYGNHNFIIKSGRKSDYEKLFEALDKVYPGKMWNHIVNLQNTNNLTLEEKVTQNSMHLLTLTQVLLARKAPAIRLLHLYPYTQNQLAMDEMQSGFAKSLLQEHSAYFYQVVGIDESAYKNERLSQLIVNEFEQGTDLYVHYINGQRLVSRLEVIALENLELKVSTMLRKNGVYLITGGLGGLGLIFAKYLAKYYQAKLILTGRSSLDEKRKIVLASIQAEGGEVLYISGDIAQKNNVKAIVKQGEKHFGKLNGIIHAAGVLHDSLITKKTQKEMQAVLSPKVQGLLYLDEVTHKNKMMDFFIAFSSMTGLLGNVGQSDYASANAFMDTYIQYRNALQIQGKRHGKAISINWPLWEEGGMQVNDATKKYLFHSFGLKSLNTKTGIDVFNRILHSSHSQVMPLLALQSRIEKIIHQTRKIDVITQVDINTPVLRQEVFSQLRLCISQVLKLPIEFIDENKDLTSYGFDSISLMEFANIVNKTYSFGLTLSLFFEYSTLGLFIDYLMKAHHVDLVKVHKPHSLIENKEITQLAHFQNKTLLLDFTNKQKKEQISIVEVAGLYNKTILAQYQLIVSIIEVEGYQVEVLVAGSGKPLVLLVPLSYSAVVWINQIRVFSKTHKVIVIHPPGYGKSDWVNEIHTIENLGEWMIKVVSAMKINQPFHLVAWSFGSLVAQCMVKQYKEKVRGLILIGFLFVNWSEEKYSTKIIASTQEFETNFKKLPSLLKKMSAVKNNKTGFMLAIRNDKVMTKYHQMFTKFNLNNIIKRLKDAPNLLLIGENDKITPPKYAQKLHQKLFNSQYKEILGAGHLAPLFSAKEVNALIKKFLMEIE